MEGVPVLIAPALEEEGGVDFAYTVDVDEVRWRFRVNMLQQLGNIGLVAGFAGEIDRRD